MTDGPCPCGRAGALGALTYARCCGRWTPDTPAPDAESLMRSRYTAYVRADTGYLRATWAPETRPERVEADPGLDWRGLEVLGHTTDGPDRARVRFVATYRSGGRLHRLAEHSRFVRRDGRWLYLDGAAGP